MARVSIDMWLQDAIEKAALSLACDYDGERSEGIRVLEVSGGYIHFCDEDHNDDAGKNYCSAAPIPFRRAWAHMTGDTDGNE